MHIETLQAIKNINNKINAGLITTEEDLAKAIAESLANTETISNSSLPRFYDSEPPTVEKYNYLIDRVDSIIKYQSAALSILKALTMVDYNYANRLMREMENKVAGLWDIYETLQFYSNSPEINGMQHVFFNFKGLDPGIDHEYSELTKSLSAERDIGLLLPIISRDVLKVKDILFDGNGHLGRLHTVNSNLIPDYYVNSYTNGMSVCDASPESWVEYETFKISNDVWNQTKGYGWKYSEQDLEPWASPYVKELRMKLTVIPDEKNPVNMLVINPVQELPFIIESVVIDIGDGKEQLLSPKNLVVTPEISEHRYPDKAGAAVYSFEDAIVEKIYINLRQPNSVPCQVLHRYYLDASGNRIDGPNPSSKSPLSMDIVSTSSKWKRKLEFLPAERFYIGIKDILLFNNTYSKDGFVISKKIKFPSEIDRVAIDVSEYIPSGCEVRYSIAFSDTTSEGATWHSIVPIGQSMRKQVIAVNDRRPISYQDPSTIYVSTNSNPKELRLKIEMSSKTKKNITPIVKNINLKVTTK